MKCHIPQISWHGKDPVLSIDFQKSQGDIHRLATGGIDSHVLIWYVSLTQNNSISLEFASDLNRHTRPVNVVRFSPNGEILASGDDEAAIILWNKQDREIPDFNEEESESKEYWAPIKVLRGHLDDICDISWSPDSNFMYSGSIDNSAIIWDIQKGKKVTIFTESKGFVQGVAWDPLNHCLASLSSDRTLRIHNVNSKRVMFKVQKAVLTPSTEQALVNKPVRIFYDDTLKSFCRRLTFSPDGELLIVPSGIIEQEDGKFQNTTYVFVRHALNKPVLHYPTGSKYSLAVRCSPILYKLRELENCKTSDTTEISTQTSLFSLPYRIIIAIATEDSIFFYDTQQLLPFAFVSNIHYTHLTDLAWSSDGQILIASSTDGYCSFVIFNKGELGVPYNQAQSTCVDDDLATSKEYEKNTITTAAAEDQDKIIKGKGQLKDTESKMDVDCPVFLEKKVCHSALVTNMCSKSDTVKNFEKNDVKLTSSFNSLVLDCIASNAENSFGESALDMDFNTAEKKHSDFLNENKCVKQEVTCNKMQQEMNCSNITLEQADSSPKIKSEMCDIEQKVIKCDPEEKQNEQEKISNMHSLVGEPQEEKMDYDDRNYEETDNVYVAKPQIEEIFNTAGNNINVSESNTNKETISQEQFVLSANNSIIANSNKSITSLSHESPEKKKLDIASVSTSSYSEVHVAKQECSKETIPLSTESEEWDLKLEPSCDNITDAKENCEKPNVLQVINIKSKPGVVKNEKKVGRRVQLITVAGPKMPKS